MKYQFLKRRPQLLLYLWPSANIVKILRNFVVRFNKWEGYNNQTPDTIWQSSSLQMAGNIPNKTWDGGWIISIFSQVKYSTFYIKTLLQVWKISQLSGESLTKKLKEIFYNLKSLLLLPEQMYIIHKSIIAKVEKLLTFMRKVLSRFLFSVLRRYLQKSWVKRKWTTWM